MRLRFYSAILWLATASVGLAQNAPTAGLYSTKLRPLSAPEGRGIVRAASREEGAEAEGRTEDCSHLVHDLYEQAGYPYPYANSLDLYDGSERFVRVSKPQPGDLIVWRGHVGIVVDQRKHSFFSSVTSGPQTEYYSSPYWRARGRARFYRYLKEGRARTGGAVLKTASRAQRQGDPAADGRAAEYRPAMQPVKTAPATAVKERSESGPASAASADAEPEKILHVGGRQPAAADVAAAFAEMNHAGGEILRGDNLEELGRPLIVYRDLRVTGMKIKGKRGTAQVEFESLAVLSGGRMEPQGDGEQLGLELLRTKKGWTMTAPKENVYVPRDEALRILAARLAVLTQNGNASAGKERQQTQIIRFLNLLVAEN
jgi:hypothetical protein